ncbi:MAG: aspartate ammonia-lyase, partial [Oscillatoriales cyanobacterium SM2_2_1]|nr:aspartate ammonia-lyase [Oscillatoriales cyanobacterium SM2_2_1]
MSEFRVERDSMGELPIAEPCYYGIQTARALDNFAISGIRPLPHYIDAGILIKKAAALVNAELGCIPVDLSMAIAAACDEVLEGHWRDQFVVDVYQAGAGTSHHMNLNEVLANRALELIGDRKGTYSRISPNDHVNYGQSTNDVIPTAIRLGALLSWRSHLMPALQDLEQQLRRQGQLWGDVVKSGRTHLQDAVPVRLGDEFTAYAHVIYEHHQRLARAAEELCVLGIGGSAAGTGMNTHPQYRE